MRRKLEEEVDNVERVLLYIAQTVEMKELYGREHPQRVAKVALDIGELFDLDEKSLTDLKMGPSPIRFRCRKYSSTLSAWT